jgi:AcrR family transcriptional regulator
VPKLWEETIEAHRSAVRDAILDTAGALIGQRGLRSVTMSQIAERTGIGRATLYKYFADVDAILLAWHERQVADHLGQLAQVRDRAGETAGARLKAVLEAYALISHEQHRGELADALHRGRHVAHAQDQLRSFLGELIAEGARTGEIRDDVPAGELASYCLHAVSAAAGFRSKAAVGRLATVIIDGLQPRA